MYTDTNLLLLDDIANNDFKNWLFPESVFNESLPIDNLKKWIRYMAVNYDDADIVLKIKDTNGSIIERLGWYNTSINTRNRYIDCIFSFKSSFNSFLRMYLNTPLPTYGELLDNYNNYFSDDTKNKFADKYKIEQKEIDSLFVQLNHFSKNTHTIGNYMPCPSGSYNAAKGFGKGHTYFKDRLELLYKELTENKFPNHMDSVTRNAWKIWLDMNKEKLYLNEILENTPLQELFKISK